MTRLLLVSNSTLHGSGYLDHCAEQIEQFLGRGVTRVLFIPFALFDRDAYAAQARARFAALGYQLDSLHEADDPRAAVQAAEAVFTGGGNTFRLLRQLYALDVLAPLRERVLSGVPYIGSSAGSNIAGLTIGTTNDMPIVEPPSFCALALVPFNLNPHYLDPDPGSTHMGETREKRIEQFHEENPQPVVGLREGSMLRREGPRLSLLGVTGARIFRRGQKPAEVPPGADLSDLLA
ncbi:dipeptidase E [Nannocystis exedens]|uniref:dipeptidase E n=1 Tax=Nannocystis exedens TaxID=54 RepID=A0A1I1U9J7_9BACT|nr:dipeptidase PepE [Nannocystis exedens]PCC71347.1 dipeptidase E [Nannocystis exedens]SFD64590.1 dipeptidase E [Nannocystis exedens]